MDKPPADDPRILEALEACRPGSDDLSDPAMAMLAARMAGSPELDSLYERLQRLDKVLADAYQDVPVPEGLADRILARLRESPLSAALGSSLEEPLPIDAPQPASRSPAGGLRRLRRTWMVGAGVLVGLAASLLIAVLLGIRSPQQPGLEQLYHAAIEDFNREFGKRGRQLAADDRFPANHPPSKFLPREDLQIQWRQVRELLQYEGVAYDLIAPGGIDATLYVVDDDRAFSVGDAPPPEPYNSGERYAAAWRENGLLYVLVVAGEKSNYLRFVWPTSAAWA